MPFERKEKEKPVFFKPKESELKEKKEQKEDDWVLSNPKEPMKKTATKKSSPKLLFEKYVSDKVCPTLYSYHGKVLAQTSWATMYELISGRFKDGDFEHCMSTIVGHQRVKTEKDRTKL